MIIIYFPKTLGESALKKLVNFMRGDNPFFSIKRVFSPHTPLFPKRTTKGEAPLESPNLCFSFYFLFLLLVVISFGYLAIYTNEHLLLLNNVDKEGREFLIQNYELRIGF